MGLGRLINGRYQPITPLKGAWCQTVTKDLDRIREGLKLPVERAIPIKK